ncbi:hypothetical protein MHPYR_410003 [uncultured Mycobacterium sp.]|uniref:Uncharacterized protein n=1 Tax=uncultured Mycobacterium sp. TaxID=171292 RepID=A0A1Y5PF82_9MYCO|nr:hypothetical protein MHPYR_410003 [uncultured Mycobacterium sp.]
MLGQILRQPGLGLASYARAGSPFGQGYRARTGALDHSASDHTCRALSGRQAVEPCGAGIQCGASVTGGDGAT